MEQVRTGATKDLAQSLSKNHWSIPLPLARGHQQLAGPSTYSLMWALEIFFALLAVAILFQAFIPLSSAALPYALWHNVFVIAIFLHASWLMYVGLRHEYSPAAVVPAVYITYGAYLLWPFALNSEATTATPWCWLLGLYGMLAPICMGNFRIICLNILGYSLALGYALCMGDVLLGMSVDVDEIILQIFYLAALCTLLGSLFGTAKYYAEHSDTVYSETLGAQLLLTRTRDQSKDLQEFDKLVHDNVMAALLDASRDEGPIAPRTIALAKRAIGVLEEQANKVTSARPITFQRLTEQIASGVYPWDDRLRFVSTDSDPYPKADPQSLMPPEAARAFVHAVTEAVSNSARHSGTRTTQISVWTEWRVPRGASRSSDKDAFIFCTVTDFGQGFNLKDLDLRRMGVRVSMLRSMEEAGGKVDINSAPYRGTQVTVRWPREADENA